MGGEGGRWGCWPRSGAAKAEGRRKSYFVRVCACVCTRERERESEREGGRERERTVMGGM